MLLARLGLHWTGNTFVSSGSIRSGVDHWEAFAGSRLIAIWVTTPFDPDSVTARVEGSADTKLLAVKETKPKLVVVLYTPPGLPDHHVVSHEIVVLLEGAPING